MDDGLDLVLAALSGGQVGPETGDWRFPSVAITPRPASAALPVFVATQSPAAVSRAAERKIPLMMSWYATMEDRERLAVAYEKSHAGADSPGHLITGVCRVGDSDAEARASMKPPLEWWMTCGVAPLLEMSRLDQSLIKEFQEAYADQIKHGAPSPQVRAEHLLEVSPIGSAETCARWMADAGRSASSSRFALFMDIGGSHADTLMNMQRLMHEVLPLVDSFASGT
jgi:alkanesulfonate monooxygenase SsuD/methylene tetrahydromethanopterin reductase-like flavin-dependent oxidoreductase (luciferase family)